MARQSKIYRSQLPPYLQSKGYIQKQRRIYERIDGKFVGMGFKLTMRNRKTQRTDVYFVTDDELSKYSFN
jgi:hypothetical protein